MTVETKVTITAVITYTKTVEIEVEEDGVPHEYTTYSVDDVTVGGKSLESRDHYMGNGLSYVVFEDPESNFAINVEEVHT